MTQVRAAIRTTVRTRGGVLSQEQQNKEGPMTVMDTDDSRTSVRTPCTRGGDELSRADTERLVDALRRMRAGDLSVRLPWQTGVLGEVADVVNGLVASHQRFHKDIAKVAKRVGREGRTDEQLSTVSDSSQLSASAAVVNEMLQDLLRPGRDVKRVIGAVLAGDLSARMQPDGEFPYRGEFRKNAQLVDSMVGQLAQLADEVTRVTREVGTEGRLGGQAKVPGVVGTWKDLTDSVNFMAENLTNQVRDIAQVTTAVANGDLTQKITADVRGEVLELKDTINTMVDQLRSFAAEVTRVAREVGTEGRLGGQAVVPGVGGTWQDLTESVNSMAGNLTSQVRDIAQVTTAVANGDLSQRISVEAKGEVAALAETINRMVDQLRSFADEVTRVAREVGMGSTFTLYLPVRRDFADDAGANAAATAAALERREERAHQRERQTRRAKRTVLVVDPDDQRIHDIVTLIGDATTSVVGARGVVEAITVLRDHKVDCAIVDIDAAAFVDELQGELAELPVIMVVRDAITDEVTSLLERVGEARPVRPVSSPRELYDATAVFVHRRPLYAVAGSQGRTTTKMSPLHPALEGRRILVVDDDPRNLFAVSSVLEAQRMEVVFAENGMDGIALLQNDPTIELVLMDIMMPGMDGYATIQVIREESRFADLPIVALTAKAMVGDREKTLAAGASDYITKPVDIDDLLRVVGDWLTR